MCVAGRNRLEGWVLLGALGLCDVGGGAGRTDTDEADASREWADPTPPVRKFRPFLAGGRAAEHASTEPKLQTWKTPKVMASGAE